MDISYPTRIVTGSYNGILKETTEYYNKLITYLIHVIEKEQTDIIIKDVEEHENERVMRLEALIHATKNNERPKYEDFDKEFPKFPSYIRRAAEKAAVGIYKIMVLQSPQLGDRRQERSRTPTPVQARRRARLLQQECLP